MEFDHSFEVIYPFTTGVDSITLGGTAGVNIPAGPTSARTSNPVIGSTRINTDTSQLEYYTGSAWISDNSIVAGTGIAISTINGISTISTTSGGGTVSSVALAAPNIFNVSGSPVTSSGTLSLSLASQSPSTVLAAPSSVSGTPSFRWLSLLQGDLSDVQLTSPSTNQTLVFNGTKWVNSGTVGANAAGLVGVGQSGAAAWTLLSGTTYYADFAHNLGTYNVVVTVFDSSTNIVVQSDLVTLTSTNNVRIQVVGNTRTLRVVVVANGQSIVAGGSTPSSVVTAQAGVTVSAAATKLNFTGQAVNVTDAGSGTTNISFGARYTYFANSLDSVNNADFAVNGLSPVTTDPSYPSLNVRAFSNTVEQGVGFTCSVPSGATQATIRLKGRAATAQAASSVVMFKMYNRLIPNNGAIGNWYNVNLANNVVPNSALFQYYTQVVPLSSIGLVAGNLYQFEITRPTSGFTGTNLAAAFLLVEVTLEFA